jgi:hypothetical protein
MKAWPEHVVALFEIAGRENTAELYRIATPIAAGTTSSATFTRRRRGCARRSRTLRKRTSIGSSCWCVGSMYCQHTATTRELCRKWKIARVIGHSEDDALDFALAQGAELAEQKFAEWVADLPRGAGASMTDRFLSAFAERVAQRVHARMRSDCPPIAEDF